MPILLPTLLMFLGVIEQKNLENWSKISSQRNQNDAVLAYSDKTKANIEPVLEIIIYFIC